MLAVAIALLQFSLSLMALWFYYGDAFARLRHVTQLELQQLRIIMPILLSVHTSTRVVCQKGAQQPEESGIFHLLS